MRSICKRSFGLESVLLLNDCLIFQITSLFQCPDITTAVAAGAPTPTLAHFIAYALHRTRLPSIVTFAALLLLQRLKARFPAARGSSGHRLFISAFMISSKVICDDTYSNQSWGIVAQKMFALKEINQMEREMCSYLEWNLNVMDDQVVEFEARIRAESEPKPLVKPSRLVPSDRSLPAPSDLSYMYPTPETTPDQHMAARPIRPVPSPYKTKTPRRQLSASILPSPPASPQNHYHASHSPPRFASADSSLASSPASDDCKTPSPVAHMSAGSSASSRMYSSKPIEMYPGFDARQRQHSSDIALNSYPIHVGEW